MNTRTSLLRCRLLLGTLALAAIGSCPQKALAQTFNWNIDGGGSWIVDANWTPFVAGDWPKDAGDIATLTFNLTTAAPITLDAAITVGTLTIGDTNASHSYTLSDGAGGSLTFNNSGSAATLTESATGLNDSVSATMRTVGDLNIVNLNTTLSRVFTLAGPLTSAAASGTQTVTFNQANANAAVSMFGAIGDGGTGGAIALAKTGSGTLTLGATNTYTGGTTLTGGTIIGNAAGALTGTFTQSGTSTVRVNNYALAVPPASADAATGAIVNASAGTFTMNSNAVAGNAVSVALGALNVSGNYAIRAGNNGTALAAATIFTLNAPLTISGAPTITSTSDANASVTIGGLTTLNSDVTIAGTTTFRFSTLAEDATPRKITRTGSGLLNMQGVANYSGGTDVLSGFVQFGVTGASGTGLIQLGDTAGTAAAEIRIFPGATVANDITVRSGSSGTMKIARDTGGTAGTGTYSGTITLQKNTIFENASSGAAGTATLDITGQVTGAGQKITVTRGSSANNQFVRFSNAANDFGFASATDDAITVGNGVFLFTSDAALGAAGNNVTLTGTAASFRAEGSFSTARKLTFTAAGAAVDATTGSELTLPADGQIAGTVDFRKGAATGTVVITGDNSARTPGTTVGGGTLRISSSANIGTASAVTLSGGTFDLRNDTGTTFTNAITSTSAVTINVNQAVGGVGTAQTHTLSTIQINNASNITMTNGNDYSLTTGAVTETSGTAFITNNFTGAGVLTIPSIGLSSGAAGIFTIGGTGNTVVSGNITQTGGGALSFIKTGAGTATLNGTASYTGSTTITTGTLRATTAAALAAGSVTVGASATLSLVNDSSTSYPYNLLVTGNSSVNVDRAIGGSGTGNTHTLGTIAMGTQTLTFTGSNDYGLNAGAVTDTDSGTLANNIGGTGVLTLTSITVSNAAAKTLTLRGAGNTVVTGGILQASGTYALVKLDAGAVTLNAATTLNGAVSIGNTTTTGGTLTMGAAGALPNGTTLSVLSGTLNMNGFNLNPGAVVLGDGPTATSANILTGAGTLTLGGNVTYNTEAGHLGASIVGNLALGGATRTFTVADTTGTEPDVTVNGPIADATGGIIKLGAGSLALTGSTANTYAGITTLNQGLLLLGKTAGVNAVPGDLSGTSTVGGNNSLVRLLAADQIADAANVTLAGVSGNGSANLDLNGFNETIATLTINNNQGTSSLVVSTGAGALTVNGNIAIAGTSTAANASALFPGLTGNVIDGNLNLGGAVRTFNVTATGNALVSAAVTNGSIVKTGATTLALAGANTFGIDTDVQAGTLELRNVAALGGRNAALNGGNFSLRHNGDGTTNPETINFAGNVILSADVTLLADRISTGPTSKTLTIAGLTMAGQTVTVTANNSYTFGVVAPLGLTASPTFNVTAGTFALIGGASDGGLGLSITKQGTGTLAFSAASAFKSLSVIGGTVAGAGPVTLYDDLAPLTLRNNTVSANVTLTGAAGAAVTFDVTNNGTATLSGQLDLGSNERIFNVPNGTSTPDLNVTGVLAGNTNWTLTGGGRMQLAGAVANSYAGNVTVSSGVLFLAKTAGTTAITGNMLVNGGSVFYADQANDQIADTASVTLDSGSFAFAPNTAGTTGNASETLANFTMNGGLFRTAVNVPAAHSHIVVTGTFTLAGGDFAINSFSSMAANKFILNGGTNVVGGNATAEINTLAIGPGGLEATGGQMKMNLSTNAAALGSRIVLGGDVTTFASAIEAGIYGESAPGTFGTRTVEIGAGTRTFTMADGDAPNDFRIDYQITGDGTLVKEGDGTLAINGLIGTGTTSVTANDGVIAIAQNQAIEMLTIGAGGVVRLNETPPVPAPAAAGGWVDDFGAPIETGATAAVPEPGAFSLLAIGALGLLRRPRRRGEGCAG